MRLEDALLYLVVRPGDRPAGDTAAFCRRAIGGGVDVILAGGGGPGAPGWRAHAQTVAAACRADDAIFLVETDAALAGELAADGVHVHGADAAFGVARAQLGLDRIVGLTARTLAEAMLGLEVGADYLVFHGPPGQFAGLREFGATPLFAAGVASLDEARERVADGSLRLCLETRALDPARGGEQLDDYSRLLGRTL